MEDDIEVTAKRILKDGKRMIHLLSELERDMERYKKLKEEYQKTEDARRHQKIREEVIVVETSSGDIKAVFSCKDGEIQSSSKRNNDDLSMMII